MRLIKTVDFNAIGNPDYDWVFKTTAQVGIYSSTKSVTTDTDVEVHEWPCYFATTRESVRRVQASFRIYVHSILLTRNSAINGMMCTYSSKEDIDSWGKLGNSGWFHEDLAPYYRKFATFTEPSKKTAEFYQIDNKVINKELHDANGPVRTAFTNSKRVGGNAWVKTFDKLGLKMTADPQSGHGNGGYR
jgi:choline dehydrogenase